MQFRLSLFVLLAALTALGCDSFDSPPRLELPQVVDGVLSDPSAPLFLAFHEPIDKATLNIKLVRFETDPEGRLFDEDDDPSTDLQVLFESNPVEDIGGVAEFDAANQLLTITLNTTPPVGPRLAILIEAGLADTDGNAWQVRQRFVFGYEFTCEAGEPPEDFKSGVYFYLAEVEEPIAVQLVLWADIRMNPDTGDLVAQFTNGDRDPNTDCSGTGLSCDPESEVCRLLPTPQCVAPSAAAGAVSEYPDWYANNIPPTGYSFTGFGCLRQQPDGSVAFGNAPVDVVVQSPPVTVKGIQLNGAFGPDDMGNYVGEGTLTAGDVFLGTSSSGPGRGTHTEIFVPADKLPAGGVPAPPQKDIDAVMNATMMPPEEG